MPLELHVIQASEFVRLGADELLDFDASAKALKGLAYACRKRGLNSALLDLRLLPPLAKRHFTTLQIAALVRIFRDAGFSKGQRLAILYRHDVYGGIRDFAFLSRMGGLQVQAFHVFEEALQWLSEAQESSAECKQAAVPVRITKRQTETRKLTVNPGKRGASANPRGAVGRPGRRPGPPDGGLGPGVHHVVLSREAAGSQAAA